MDLLSQILSNYKIPNTQILINQSQENPQLRHFKFLNQKYGKIYKNHTEFKVRFSNFANNSEFIESHNSNPNHKFKLGLNQFYDLSFEDYQNQVLHLHDAKKLSYLFNCSSDLEDWVGKNADLGRFMSSPIAEIDWSQPTKNYLNITAVTKIKNQKFCGNCYAQAASVIYEGQICLKNQLQLHVSETKNCQTWPGLSIQNLMENSHSTLCQGGRITNVLEYLMSDNFQPAVKVCGHVSPHNLKLAISQIGPLATVINANSRQFMFYSSGVFQQTENSKDKINHAVGLIGYGLDHFLIKNSFGESWGEHGLMKLSSTFEQNLKLGELTLFGTL